MLRTFFLLPVIYSSALISISGNPAKCRKLPLLQVATNDLAANTVSFSPSPPVPPSWEELSIALSKKKGENEEEHSPEVLLFRDTNGWCPFCERIWLALRAKNIPFEEELINLRDKPNWYKRLVPSALVPALVLYGDGEKHERRLVWESLDILQALDDEFPSSPKLVWDTPEYIQALEEVELLTRAGFVFLYASRNETLSDEDKEKNRLVFMERLDKLDSALAQSKGPFRLGQDFSGIDVVMIPTLERWRYQTPITNGLDILENRPNLVKWFEAMDSFAPYGDRVRGDRYSWTATNAMFLRYFGGGEDKPEVAEAIQRSERLAEEITSSFATAKVDERFAIEVAEKLITNHAAVIRDCTNPNPMSQKDVPRASDEEIADLMLRFMASVLLAPSPTQTAQDGPLVEIPESHISEASCAVRAVAARLCVPRDMGAPAAGLLRKVLAIVADRLEEKVSSN